MRNEKKTSGFLSLAALWAVLLIVGPLDAWAGTGSAGDLVCNPGVLVRGKARFTNNSGVTADDFHFYMYQSDRPNVVVNGARATTGAFSSVGVALGTDNGTGSPPPGNHGAQVDMSGGSVPPGGTVTVAVEVCMNERNSLKFKDIVWTSGGVPIPQNKLQPKAGWRVKRPFPGGNGGNPGNPGGGGQGAQQGNGGGGGNFVHIFCIENDSATDCLQVNEVKLLATDMFFADLDGIDWASIDPIKNFFGEPPVIIPPLGEWCYEFQTTGAYLNGHIYMNYDVEVVTCPGVAPRGAPAGGGGSMQQIGDHPPETLSTDDDGDGLHQSYEDKEGPLDDNDDGSGNPDNGATGDPDSDGLINTDEQDLLTNAQDPNDPWTTQPGFSTLCTSNAVTNHGVGGPPPIPADFFGPGSDPFVGVIQYTGNPLIGPPCGSSPVDTLIERFDTMGFPDIPSSAQTPIELTELSLASVEPILVTFNGGQNPQLWDVSLGLDPDPSKPSLGQMVATRDHWNGGLADMDINLQAELTFTQVGNPSNVQFFLFKEQVFGVFAPFQRPDPGLACGACSGDLVLGFECGNPSSFMIAGQQFQQIVQTCCDPFTPGPCDIPEGTNVCDVGDETSQTWGHGFPPIPADFFDPGSDPFEGKVPLVGGNNVNSPDCIGPFGSADTLIRRSSDPFDRCELPASTVSPVAIEIVALNLQSADPITVTFNGGLNPELWDVSIDLSSVPSTGEMFATKTHANGGTFTSELFVQPVFTFTKVVGPGEIRVLDTGQQGEGGSYLRIDDAPWVNSAPELGQPNCTGNFIPGVDGSGSPRGKRVVVNVKVPLKFSGGPLTLTLGPTDLGNSDSWADFAFTGLEIGSFDNPFDTLAEVIGAVPAGGTVKLKGNTGVNFTTETPRIDKAMRIEAIGGSVRLGGP